MFKKIDALILSLHTADGTIPEWLHLVPAGTFSGVDGRGPYVADLKDATAVIELFNREGRKLPVDENHSTELAPKNGQPSPARGWIVELQTRDDGIWGRVEWTGEGKALMTDKSYNWLSPVFYHGAQRPYRVTKLASVALTNNPNINSLTSLHTQENAMLEELRKVLGLPETADEAAVMAAVAAAHTAHTAQAGNVALMSRIAEAAGVTADAAPDVLVAAIHTKRAPSATDAENASLKDQVSSLHTQLTALATSTAVDKATSAIDAAIEGGKLVPALRDHYIARHTKNPSEVETELKLMPSLHAGGLGGRTIPDANSGLTAEDDKVAAMMGVDPTAFAAEAKALHGKGN